MASDLNIQIDNVAASYRARTWECFPGEMIFCQAQCSRNDHSLAVTLFKRVVNEKIPQAQSIINKLGSKHNIREFHWPLALKTVFFIFMDELVEHYQNHIEQRDEELDREYLKLKRVLAKSVYQLWPRDRHEINDFLNLLKNKLSLVDGVPEGFDDTISNWSGILNIQYVANMKLIEIFLPSNYAKQHRLPTSQLSPEETFCHINSISHAQMVQAFSLLSRQLSKDAPWVVQTMLEKLPPLNNKKLEDEFFRLTASNTQKNELKQRKKGFPHVSSLVQEYAGEMKEILDQLSSLNIRDNEQILELNDKSINTVFNFLCQFTQDFEDRLTEKTNGTKQFEFPDGTTISSNHELFQPLMNYSECTRLKSFYIDSHVEQLIQILEAITFSNAYWDEHLNHGTVPPLYRAQEGFVNLDSARQSKIEAERSERARPLLNSKASEKERFCKAAASPNSQNLTERGIIAPSVNAISDEHPQKQIDEPISSHKKGVKLQRKAPRGKDKHKRPAAPAPSTTTTTSTISTVVTPPPSAPSSRAPSTAATAPSLRPIEVLRRKLGELHSKNPSSPLRQAMWHFDHLIVIQGSLAQSTFTTPEHLCLMASATNCAQKTLEQTYRYCLRQEQASFETTHNLKTYHKQLDPDSTTYPSVVNDLFLANDWHRYFYAQHKKWTAHTTFHVKIPPVLEKLYKIAEGQPYTSEDLKKTVEEMIKNTSKHLDTLLKQVDVPANDKLSPREKVQWVKIAFQEQKFTGVQQTLENFLKNLNANHPIYSSAKQALASLKILEASIQQMNKANDIREFSTWTVGSLLQVQESMENVFHCIEYYQKGKISVQHELKTLAEQLGIEMGALGEQTHQLSYKVRYPAEIKNSSLSAQIIDDLEALKEFPDLEKGFKLQTTPKILWAHPSSDISQGKIVEKMQGLLVETEKFLREKAVPALYTSCQTSSKNSTN